MRDNGLNDLRVAWVILAGQTTFLCQVCRGRRPPLILTLTIALKGLDLLFHGCHALLTEAINGSLLLILNLRWYYVIRINLANAILAVHTAEDRTVLLLLFHAVLLIWVVAFIVVTYLLLLIACLARILNDILLELDRACNRSSYIDFYWCLRCSYCINLVRQNGLAAVIEHHTD